MKSWVADFQSLRSLAYDDAHPSVVLARPPSRLGLAADEVVVHAYSSLSPEQSAALLRRLEEVAATPSAHLTTLIEAGRDDRAEQVVTYYVTEYVAGGSLAQGASDMDTAAKLRFVADAALGAHDLHEGGLVHGDIRPSAVRLAPRGAVLSEPRFPQLDEPGLTLRVTHSADLDVIDPAIGRGEDRSRASDIWAIGATLHAVLTGRLLHVALADDRPAIGIQRIIHQRPVVDPQLPDAQAKLIGSCLAPEPVDRPGSAFDLAQQLFALAGAR